MTDEFNKTTNHSDKGVMPYRQHLFERLNEVFNSGYTHDNQIEWTDFDTEDRLLELLSVLEENVDWKKYMYGEVPCNDIVVDTRKMHDSEGNCVERNLYTINPDSINGDSHCKVIPDAMLEKCADKFDWVFICLYQPMNEEKIIAYSDYVNWIVLSMYRTMSENTLRRFKDKVVWKYIPNVVTCQNLSDSFVDEFADKVNWTCVCTYSDLSLPIMKKYAYRLNWKNVCAYQDNVTEEFLEYNIDKVDWTILSGCKELSEQFIERHKNRIDWKALMNNQLQHIDDDFVIKYQDYININEIRNYDSEILTQVRKLNWEELLLPNYRFPITMNRQRSILEYMDEDDIDWHNIKNGLPVQFINNHPDMIDWHYLSTMFSPDDDFLERYKAYMDWDFLVVYNRLSENQLRRFRNNVSWKLVSIFYKMNDYFIAENAERVDWSFICAYQILSEEFIRQYRDFVKWNLIFRYQKLSDSAMDEFKGYAEGRTDAGNDNDSGNRTAAKKDLRPLLDFSYLPKDGPINADTICGNKEMAVKFTAQMQEITKALAEIFGK